MKSRCWTLLCLIFLSGQVRLSRTNTLRDFNQVQQDILYHGESGESSGYLQEVRPQDNSEGLLQSSTDISLLTRKDKKLRPQGGTSVGNPKRHGIRSSREEDNSFVNSGSKNKVRKCSCSKSKKRKGSKMLTRKKLDSNVSNSTEASSMDNSQTSSESIISIAPVTAATQRPLESIQTNFDEKSTTSASMETILNNLTEDVSTNIDIKYKSTVSPNADFNDVNRTEENLPPNSNFTNSTPDVADSLKINGSLFTTKTQTSMDLLHTTFESVTERRLMSGTTSLEGKGNNNLHENSIKKLPRKKKCKKKLKQSKAMVLSKRTTKPVDSGHNNKIQSTLPPTSGQTTPVTDKSSPELTSSEVIPVWDKPSPAPTSSEATFVTHEPSAAPTSVHTMLVTQEPKIDEQQTQKIWPSYMITIREPNRVSQNSLNYKNYPDYSGFGTLYDRLKAKYLRNFKYGASKPKYNKLNLGVSWKWK